MSSNHESKPGPQWAQQLNIAHQLRQAGRLQEAQSVYDQVLRVHPLHPDALLGAAMVAHQCGKHELAVELLERAISQNSAAPHLYGNLALVLSALGRQEDAIRAYRKAIDLNPDYAEAHFNLGIVLRQQGKLKEAIDHYRQVLRLRSDFAPAHNALGNALRECGEPAAAVAAFEQALRLSPGSAMTWFNLAGALKDLDRLDESANKYQQALHLKPDYADAYGNLAHVQMLQGKHREAAQSYAQALEITPDSAELHLNNAIVMQELGRFDAAAASIQRAAQISPGHAHTCAVAFLNLGILLHHQQRQLDAAITMYRQAVRLNPDMLVAYINLGNAYADVDNVEAARECFERALTIDPAAGPAHFGIGNLCVNQGRLEEAAACYRRALELDPAHLKAAIRLMHLLQRICLWENLGELTGRVIDLLEHGTEANSPFPLLAIDTSEAQQLRFAQKYAREAFGGIAALDAHHTPRAGRMPKAKITVGYLSADFRQHAVAYLTAELFERHDRDNFRILGYSYGSDDGSPLRQRLVKGFDGFADIRNQSYLESVRRISDDGVDILVDLTGYTEKCRTQILALRPAPVQVSYLGYIGTMGAEFIDYIIADRFVIPPDHQPYYSEKTVYMPDCFQVNDSQRPMPQTRMSRTELGLPETGFVFCCFNNSYKLTPRMFDVWMRLLLALPGSVLWLAASNATAADNLRREAERRGVAANRILFAPIVPQADYLAQYRDADLFLDTLPYNAGTTASDALWSGCPVVTCAGQNFASRMAGSILRAAGLPDLVTDSLSDYEALALRLAQNPDELAAVKKRLMENIRTAPLFDCGRFARHLEAGYQAMWSRYMSGGDPAPIEVPVLMQ